MRDSVSRTLIAFVATQILFMVLLPLVLIPPPEGLDLSVYALGFTTARDIVFEAAAGTVVLFTIAIWIQRRFWLVGFLPTTPLVGLSLVLAPFWVATGGLSGPDLNKSTVFFLGFVLIALFLGAVFWFMVVMERRDYD